MENQRSESKSVPLIIFESEMKHKTTIICGLIALLSILIIVLGASVYLFISFINNYDFADYDQNGDGVNIVNTGQQGDIINESTIEH